MIKVWMMKSCQVGTFTWDVFGVLRRLVKSGRKKH